MPAPIEFWFDFSSAYAYFASLEIDGVAERLKRPVLWRPFMLGTAFKRTGARGLSATPLKGNYARHDWARIAREKDVPFALPPFHPIVALPSSRAFYWLDAQDPALAVRFAKRVFSAYYGEQQDLRDANLVALLGAELGIDAQLLLAALEDQEVKERFRAISDAGIDKGVFGSPFFIVGDEHFWGWDRIPQLEKWARAGGW